MPLSSTACRHAWRLLPKSFYGCEFVSARNAARCSFCARIVIAATATAARHVVKAHGATSAAAPTAATSGARKAGSIIATVSANIGSGAEEPA